MRSRRFTPFRRTVGLAAAVAGLSCGDDPTSPVESNDPNPTLTSISPEEVFVGTGAPAVKLTGTNFQPTATVAFSSGIPGRSFSVTASSSSSTQLTVVLPSTAFQSAGTYQVRVVNPAPGGSSETRTFTVRAPIPVISALSHTTAQAGAAADTLFIDGTGFYSESMVLFNGAIRAATLVTPSRLRVILGSSDLATPGSYDLAVLNPSPGGGASTSRRFEVIALPPTLVALPSLGGTAGQGGFALAVDGANFVNGSVVQWNGADRPTTFRTSTRLTAAISATDAASAGVVRITVRNPGVTQLSNAVEFTLRVVGAAMVTNHLAVDLPASDVVYDSRAQLLYASIPSASGAYANSVVALDPETGQVTKSVSVGSTPTQLALSDDGQFAYVSLEGSSSVRRINLSSFTPDLEFALGTGMIVEDMLVIPGAPRSVVLGKTRPGWIPGHQGVFVYDDGVQRGAAAPGHIGSNTIAFSGRSASVLYGYDNQSTAHEFTVMSIDAAGIRESEVLRDFLSSFYVRLVGANGRLYGTNGVIIDPELRLRAGSFTGSGGGGATAVRPDPTLGRVFFLSDGVVAAFDMNTRQSLGSIKAPGTIKEDPATTRLRLVRWGTDGLAYRDGTKTHILRTPLAAY